MCAGAGVDTAVCVLAGAIVDLSVQYKRMQSVLASPRISRPIGNCPILAFQCGFKTGVAGCGFWATFNLIGQLFRDFWPSGALQKKVTTLFFMENQTPGRNLG